MVFSGTHGSYYWAEGHGEPVRELLQAHPAIALGKRALLYGWDDRLLKQGARVGDSGWRIDERRALSHPITEVAQLSTIRQDVVTAWAFFSVTDPIPDLAQVPPKPPLPPSDRSGSLRDTSYLRDEPAPGRWREDVPGWAAFVADMQRRFWDTVEALGPESFLRDWRTFVFVTKDRRLHEVVIAWLRACEAADPIMATRLLDTRTLAPDRHVLDLSVGPGGEVVALSAERPIYRIERREHSRGVSHVPVRELGSHRYRLHRLAGTDTAILDLPETADPLGMVQPLGGGRWLLVRDWDRGADRHNAYVYTPDGRRIAAFSIRRGYNQVHATGDDRVWIGYHDEGVYKYSSFGQAGAVCLDLAGRPLLRFLDIAKQNGLPPIDDCKAINVDGDNVVWLYYYGEYPLVRLVAGRFDRIWRNLQIGSARGFAVAEGRALFAGGGRYPDLLALVDLETRAVEKLCPVDQHGAAIKFTGAIGRGSHLYLRTEHELFAIDPASWARAEHPTR